MFINAKTHYNNSHKIYSELNKVDHNFQTKFFQKTIPDLDEKIEHLQQITKEKINVKEKSAYFE